MYEAKITATGKYVPSKIVTNEDICNYVDTSNQWIEEMTGIHERRFVENENSAILAIKAAKDILLNSNLNGEDIDFIIVSSTTPSDLMPSLSSKVQSEIGAKNAGIIDINAACTGFIYALDIALQYIRSGKCKNIMIIASETMSKILDYKDRSTLILFGDGAAGIILSRSDKESVIDSYVGGYGELGQNLKLKIIDEETGFINNPKIEMNGREVFKFSTKVVVTSIETILSRNNLNIQDIDYIIPHQANYRIIKFAAERLGIDIEKFQMNLDKYGNTSSASIPILLEEMNKKGILKRGNKIILVGFGGGLTFGSVLINW